MEKLSAYDCAQAKLAAWKLAEQTGRVERAYPPPVKAAHMAFNAVIGRLPATTVMDAAAHLAALQQSVQELYEAQGHGAKEDAAEACDRHVCALRDFLIGQDPEANEIPLLDSMSPEEWEKEKA